MIAAKVPAPGWLLLSLVFGFGVGLVASRLAFDVVEPARLIGGLWIDGLRMTIVPLIFALVVTGVAGASAQAAGGGVAGRALLLFVALLFAAAILAALIVPPLLALWTPPADAVAALRAGIDPAIVPKIPPTAEGLRAIMPVNVVAAAADGAIVPLVIFALIFGLAIARIATAKRAALLDLFQATADAMLVIVGWVLRLAPFGIFALALVVGATAGVGAGLALGHYILVQIIVAIVLILFAQALGTLAAGVPPAAFARAVLPAQAVAASTQSSIASLPAMLASAERIGVAENVRSVTLPLAVAIFKISAPSGSLIMALTLARMAGVEVGFAQLALAVPVAVLSTLAIIGVPGQVSFFAAATPTVLALGAPIELLPILLAVDTIPDIFRTVANVTADVTVTGISGRAMPASRGTITPA